MKKLASFLETQINMRQMSVRAFALFIDVPHAVVLKFLNKKGGETGYPSIEFIRKLAAGTSTDPCTILAMVIPDSFSPERINSAELLQTAEMLQDLNPEDLSTVILLAKRLQKLPPEARVAIDAIAERYER